MKGLTGLLEVKPEHKIDLPDGVDMSHQDLFNRLKELLANNDRVFLGLIGSPGAGKSTLAERIAEAFPEESVVLPMDGFHLSNRVLIDLGIRDIKGAPETFDASGFVSVLQRVVGGKDSVVYSPLFEREREEPLASGIPISAAKKLVVVEGNYLLCDFGAWQPIADLLTESWFVNPGEQVRLTRLYDRHVFYGKDSVEAEKWTFGSDHTNARVIAATAGRADLVIRLTD